MTGPTRPRLSFIVPVRNDAARLEGCLRSIRKNHAAESAEVLVIDNGSTDGSGIVARKLGARVLELTQGSVAALRNRGAKESTGDILAFVDADHEIGPTWIEVALETLALPDVGAVGALCRAPAEGTWVQRAYEFLRGRPHGQHDVEWLGSGNLAMWRSAFDRAGGFDETLRTCEDVDLCYRLRGTGLRVVSDARLENVHHGDPRTLRELFSGELWRGRDNVRVSVRGPVSLRALPSALLPIADLLLMVVAGLGLVNALAGVRAGILMAGAAVGLIIAASLLRVMRAFLRGEPMSVGQLAQTLGVAFVYDLARALALVARVGDRERRQATTAVS